MTKAAKLSAERLSPGAAQRNEQPSQPGGASASAACQAASDSDTLLHGLLRLDQVELKLVSSFISALGTAHDCSRAREERDTLYQQLFMRLYRERLCRGERRCAETSALLDSLKAALPADARTGADSKGLLQTVLNQMSGVSELVKLRLELAHLALVLPATPAEASLQLAQVVAAKRSARGWVRDNVGRAMLEHASKDEEVGRRAEAIIECLDTQARPAF